MGIAFVITIRFICHFISGIVIWGQWADDMAPVVYSLIYNAQYMVPELALTMIGAITLLKTPHVRRLFSPAQS